MSVKLKRNIYYIILFKSKVKERQNNFTFKNLQQKLTVISK